MRFVDHPEGLEWHGIELMGVSELMNHGQPKGKKFLGMFEESGSGRVYFMFAHSADTEVLLLSQELERAAAAVERAMDDAHKFPTDIDPDGAPESEPVKYVEPVELQALQALRTGNDGMDGD